MIVGDNKAGGCGYKDFLGSFWIATKVGRPKDWKHKFERENFYNLEGEGLEISND